MAVIGFSLNNLTLFGLVLAIGIVVDDAIVVVEAVEHHIENGLRPREATIRAMEQVSGPVIAVGLVLSAVFVPCAFISGITGHFFRQFALTIAVSTIISAFCSLTLSPALTALLLRPRREEGPPLPRLAFPVIGAWLGWVFLAPALVRWSVVPPAWIAQVPWWSMPAATAVAGALAGWQVSWPLNWLLGAFFRAFNAGFRRATGGYVRLVGGLLRVGVAVLVVYGGLVGLTYWEVGHTPRGFIPSQDMGYLMVTVQLPDSASMERTEKVMRQLEGIVLSIPGVKHVSSISGMSFILQANGSNFGSMFLNLNDYSQRRDPVLSSDSIINQLRGRIANEVHDAVVAVFPPPPVRGVGRAGGFALMIEDRGDKGAAFLQEQTENLVRKGSQTPGLLALFAVFRANVPQLHIEPNPATCMMRGVNMQDFAATLSVYEGSLYVNDFNRFGRTWQVIVQAEQSSRGRPEDLTRLSVRNTRGAMVPVGSLASIREVNGPLVLTRYNMYTAASINGASAPGTSSGDAIAIVQRLADAELPQSMAYEWTDMSYLELLAGNTAMIIFGFAVVMVFLVLAAQYESWSLPLAVILVVPLCILCAVVGVQLAHQDINIFTQIGFVVLIGLASKNAILIVEYARRRRHSGHSRRDAVLEACRLRLRPIVMTSVAFVLGVLPLIVSTGAGAEMRRTLGTAVFSGMIGVTLFGIVLTPIFFAAIDWLSDSGPFASRRAHRLGSLALDVLTLRGAWKMAALAVRTGMAARRAPQPVETIEQK
jgi:multidrug efflux pump